VADLSSLWAGPLCGNVLSLAGARVIKVESTQRPDGTRAGPDAFFDLIHGGQESVALDLAAPAGVAALRELLAGVDVVIEGSRPRALEQLGIDAAELLRAGRPKVWVSVTGHGRSGQQRDWAAFGDDAAVAGGLVVWDEAGPCFCADAVADPATGLVAAAACLGLLAEPGRWLVDVPMAGVAAWLAGAPNAQPALRAAPDAAAPDGSVITGAGRVMVAAPRARPVSQPGPALGADTSQVLSELRAGGLRAGRLGAGQPSAGRRPDRRG
jgi:crotonobetainyl-CoA:carnitine CoA-transferase CaiB-like acyl-CoA transferase